MSLKDKIIKSSSPVLEKDNVKDSSFEYIAEMKNGRISIFKKEIFGCRLDILEMFLETLNLIIKKCKNVFSSFIKVKINSKTGKVKITHLEDLEIEKFLNSITDNEETEEVEEVKNNKNCKKYSINLLEFVSEKIKVFSKFLKIKICDIESGNVYEQEWNKDVECDLEITKTKMKKSYVEIVWIPNFVSLKFDRINLHDLNALYYKHIIDVAILTDIKVYINKNLITVSSLANYSKLYNIPLAKDNICTCTKDINILITPSSGDFQFTFIQDKVINFPDTQLVNTWLNYIFSSFNDVKKVNEMKNHLCVFVQVLNPEKINSMLKSNQSCLSASQIKKLNRWPSMKTIDNILKTKKLILGLKRDVQSVNGYRPCTEDTKFENRKLIICETTSIKSHLVNNLSVVNNLGFYPLRSALLNVRKSKPGKIIRNKVISDLITIINLFCDVDYCQDDNFSKLSFNQIIFAVNDVYTKGLVLNFIHYLFPSLLSRNESFIVELKSPFNNIQDIVRYKDDIYSQSSLNKAFYPTQKEEKKKWLDLYTSSNSMEIDSSKTITISQFVDNILVKSLYNDYTKNIPSLLDGFTSIQRQIVSLSKTLTDPLSISVFAGKLLYNCKDLYIQDINILYNEIVKLAQGYKNNIPFLNASGQTGSKLEGNKDVDSLDKILVKLNPLTSLLYIEDISEDYQTFVPILPTILVNGSGDMGINSIPCYNPIDLVEYIESKLNNEDNADSVDKVLVPWYFGYKGTIVRSVKNRWISSGILQKETNGTSIFIRDIPIGISVSQYIETVLNKLIENNILHSFIDRSTEEDINIELIRNVNSDLPLDNIRDLKLFTYLHTSNMILLDENNKPKKYDSVEDIINSFIDITLKYYSTRKERLMISYKEKISILTNKSRFIKEINIKKIKINDNLASILEKRKYDKEHGGYLYLLNMSISLFGDNSLKKIDLKLENLRLKLNKLNESTEKDMWLKDLHTFSKKFRNIFKL